MGVQISVNDAHGVQVSLQVGEARGEDKAPLVSMLSLSCCPGSLWRWPLSSPRDGWGQHSPRATLAPGDFPGRGWCLEARLLESQRREQPCTKGWGGEAVGLGDGLRLRTQILVLIGPSLPHQITAGLKCRQISFFEHP